ncbi:MAG: hypothetical protein ACO3HN_06415 [Opitutales bacterium]
MKHAVRSAIGAIGPEGALLLVGTVCLAVFSSFISPAGPWLVVGAMCVLAGIALALPQRRA